ncbi:MAG: Alpha-ketoglutarate-dependent dioxygenase AlkB, partial [uncultured Thiotrichaceae bacterium]
MDLFNNIIAEPINLLPHDGIANYYGSVFSMSEADEYFRILLETISWKNDEAIIYGKRIVTKRKVAWYADRPFQYTYSKTTKTALPWTKELLALKARVEQKSGEHYN